MKQKFDVTGMSCSACSAHVEKAVSRVPGVDQVQVNLLQNSMVVEYEDEATDAAAIIHAVQDMVHLSRMPMSRRKKQRMICRSGQQKKPKR